LSHARDFSLESGDEWTGRQLILDYRMAKLAPQLLALCDYAIKLTLAPGAMSQADINALRASRWNDEQIHLATQVIAYFNYINRIADGLGVDDEPWMHENGQLSRDAWLAAKSHWQS
jgi:uncharacterized peroxidase-related enzyme